MKHFILKNFVSDGKPLKYGDIVDTSKWMHIANLESMRYIRPLTEEEESVPKATKKTKVAAE
jgi:hypothetical protein